MSIKTATLLHESNNKREEKNIPLKPKTAVIVAAGNGTRLRQGRRNFPPKPLFKLGGLRLIERVILTLKSRGFEKFRIVVGYRGDEVIAALKQSRILKKHAVEPELVRCPDFEKGNGHSLAGGARGIDEPFVLTMSDHVYDTRQVDALLGAAEKNPESLLLVTDPEPERTFDLDDATKVKTAGKGAIVDIGKEIGDYDQVDTGLFYFPAGASRLIGGEIGTGSHSISDIVRRYIERRLFSAVPVKGANWQDVDNQAMARQAEKMLLQSLVKPTDGFVSRHLNRKISIPLSALLVRFGVTPNMVTAGTLFIGLIATALVLFPQYLWIAAILFQLTSVLDGSDGEISRLTWSGSKSGAWFDSISDAVRYVSFYAALGISLALSTPSPVTIIGTAAFLVLCLVSVLHMVMHLRRNSNRAVFFAVSQELKNIPDAEKPWWQRLSLRLLPVYKLDFLALLTMALLLAGLVHVVFALSILCAVLMAVNVFHLVRKRSSVRKKTFIRRISLPDWGKTLSSIAGLSLFAFALCFVPWEGVLASITQGGWQILAVFLIPLGWFLSNTAGLHTLLGGAVAFKDLLYNRLVGDALNASLPMANLGGEPYKVFHLSRFVRVETAIPAIISDKIINTGSGLIFSGIILTAGYFLPHGITHPLVHLMVPAGALSAAAGFLLALLLISPLLRALLNKPFKWFRRDAREIPQLKPVVLLSAMAWHLTGRVLLIAEYAALLWLLTGQPPAAVTLIILTGFTGLIGQVFFMIPQGLGVNEISIAGILMLLGYGESAGMAVALLRRGRMVFWAIVGLGLFGLSQGMSLIRRLHPVTAPTTKSF